MIPLCPDCGSSKVVREKAKIGGKYVDTDEYYCLYCAGLW